MSYNRKCGIFRQQILINPQASIKPMINQKFLTTSESIITHKSTIKTYITQWLFNSHILNESTMCNCKYFAQQFVEIYRGELIAIGSKWHENYAII